MICQGIGLKRAGPLESGVDMCIAESELYEQGEMFEQVDIDASKPLKCWPGKLVFSSYRWTSLDFDMRCGNACTEADIWLQAPK